MPRIGSNSVDAGAVAERLRTLTSAATPSENHPANFIGDQQNAQKVYEAFQYSPARVREGQATPQAIAVISAIESSQQKGLNPEDYDASHWPERMAVLKAAPGNADTVASFDAELTVNAMRRTHFALPITADQYAARSSTHLEYRPNLFSRCFASHSPARFRFS